MTWGLAVATEWATILGFLGGVIAAVYHLVRKIVRWALRMEATADRMEIVSNAVQLMQTNHLPHIHHLLRLICDKLSIPYSESEGERDGRN
jgi:hypothetical protein